METHVNATLDFNIRYWNGVKLFRGHGDGINSFVGLSNNVEVCINYYPNTAEFTASWGNAHSGMGHKSDYHAIIACEKEMIRLGYKK